MRIPAVKNVGNFVLHNLKKHSTKEVARPPFEPDIVAFQSSTAWYLKKYKTLPSKIKNILKPKDAIDMFREMEQMQKGNSKIKKVAQGNYSKIYENPWLEDYFILISKNPEQTNQLVYTRQKLGECIWSDKDNNLIQIIEKAN